MTNLGIFFCFSDDFLSQNTMFAVCNRLFSCLNVYTCNQQGSYQRILAYLMYDTNNNIDKI